jgi:hypothetical protein
MERTGKPDPRETIVLDEDDISQLDELSLTTVMKELTFALEHRDGKPDKALDEPAADADEDSGSAFDDFELGILDSDED